MSNNLKVGLMGLVAVALVVNGYFLWKKSDGGTSTEKTGVVASNKKAKALDAKSNSEFNTAPGAEKNYTIEKSIEPVQKEQPNDPKTAITFANMEHDFGKIDQNTENEYIFKFTNTGTNPLLIYKAKGSCGCTVPQYPKEPIAPGEDGEIKVVYKPGKQKNKQTKWVTVTANTEPGDTKVKIMADVQFEEPEG